MDDLFRNLERNNNLRAQVLKACISGVMTDDERAKLFGLPEGCRMRENAKIIDIDKFKCGKYVWIGEGAVLDASGGLEIGDHTSIGLGVYVWSHSSFLANLTYNNIIGNPLITRAENRIGKGCFIAGPSVIYHGITVGDRTLVLPMSVVSKNIPGHCIIGGNPAKVIKEVNEEYIDEQIKKFRESGQI